LQMVLFIKTFHTSSRIHAGEALKDRQGRSQVQV